MKRNWLSRLAPLAVVGFWAWMQSLPAQSPASNATSADSFQRSVQPFLAKHCFACHNEKLKTASLDLASYRDEASAVEHPEIWDKVREKVTTGKMPPPGLPAPSKIEVGAVTEWIGDFLARSGFTSVANPGRVMARRLNRVEYNNTIRDLLAVAYRPADDFPVDDSGYGFDNIADVLTISPMLMEKYLAAARTASRLAVHGETFPDKPILLTHLMAKRSYDIGEVSGSNYLPYAMRGNLYGSFVFPVDAEYEIRFRVMNLRGDENADRPRNLATLTPEERAERRRRRLRPTPEEAAAAEQRARDAAEPLKLVLTLDGEPILQDVIEGTTTFGYARGEFVAKVPVKAGEHFLRVSFPELADIDDPRKHLNSDLRRKVFADYLDVAGPFNPSTEPPASYRKLFICGHERGAHEASCGRMIVSNLARRAYRRPVTAAEVDEKLRLVALAQREGDSFEEGVRLAVEAILASPHFLFKIERDPGTGAGGAAHPISEHELASRLSYFLWSSMPDEELFRAADAGNLRKPGVLEGQVRRMMADAKARNLVDNFAAQWLQLRNLGRTKPDGARFPTVDDELLDAMRRETSLFVEAIIREDRSILDFIDAPFTYLNGILARHYGISGVTGEKFRRVELDGEQRSGLLTQAAILTVSSYPTRTSIPVRGKWVLENLLGSAPPPPPPDVPVLDESKVGTTVSLRERLEQHRSDPNCSGCHMLTDPIGFGLESYDAIGAWRTHDGEVPIDTSGVLPDGKSFRGARDLKQILKGQEEAFTRNLAEKLLTFALGRGLERYDAPTVERMVRQTAANDYRFSNLVFEIVKSEPFQMRAAAGEKP